MIDYDYPLDWRLPKHVEPKPLMITNKGNRKTYYENPRARSTKSSNTMRSQCKRVALIYHTTGHDSLQLLVCQETQVSHRVLHQEHLHRHGPLERASNWIVVVAQRIEADKERSVGCNLQGCEGNEVRGVRDRAPSRQTQTRCAVCAHCLRVVVKQSASGISKDEVVGHCEVGSCVGGSVELDKQISIVGGH